MRPVECLQRSPLLFVGVTFRKSTPIKIRGRFLRPRGEGSSKHVFGPQRRKTEETLGIAPERKGPSTIFAEIVPGEAQMLRSRTLFNENKQKGNQKPEARLNAEQTTKPEVCKRKSELNYGNDSLENLKRRSW